MKTIKLIAHRGLHKGKEIPENSMLAFQKAVEKNYGIELDITISKAQTKGATRGREVDARGFLRRRDA